MAEIVDNGDLLLADPASRTPCVSLCSDSSTTSGSGPNGISIQEESYPRVLVFVETGDGIYKKVWTSPLKSPMRDYYLSIAS